MLVTVAGGGPTGLAFALKLTSLMRGRATVTVFDRRWKRAADGATIWMGASDGNHRREQVITLQSRQYLELPRIVRDRLFAPGSYSEMWPQLDGELAPPRNVRISTFEDVLLRAADADPDIRLCAQRFEPSERALAGQHVLVIADGARSATREKFIDKFGEADERGYSLDGAHLEDTVLGLLVESSPSDAVAVTLTIAQNRYLLNSLGSHGFLNMRLTPAETAEAVAVQPSTGAIADCLRTESCLMTRAPGGFRCAKHQALFAPALQPGRAGRSPEARALWPRILEGLALFGIAEEQVAGIRAFRMSLVQRPRFTAELRTPTAAGPGTFGCLIGDAANAAHFWPGRGMNGGLISAFSLAHCLASRQPGRPLRDADFLMHEALTAMVQHRNKARSWRAMTAPDGSGGLRAIRDAIAEVYADESPRPADHLRDEFAQLLRRQRDRIGDRIPQRISDEEIDEIAGRIAPITREALLRSGPWDTVRMGGHEPVASAVAALLA